MGKVVFKALVCSAGNLDESQQEQLTAAIRKGAKAMLPDAEPEDVEVKFSFRSQTGIKIVLQNAPGGSIEVVTNAVEPVVKGFNRTPTDTLTVKANNVRSDKKGG